MPCQSVLEVNLINFPTTFINVMINSSKLSGWWGPVGIPCPGLLVLPYIAYTVRGCAAG